MNKRFERNQINFQNGFVKQSSYDQKIQQRYSYHMKMMKKLNISSKAFQKISKAYFDIKTNIISICQVLQSDCFSGISLNLGKTLLQIITQANSSISDHCKQYSNQLYNLFNMYSELGKQKYEKYQQQKQNLQHYIKKVRSLSKNPAEKDRYQRNVDKMKLAKFAYETTSKQVNLMFGKINQEAEKIWQKNFIGFTSVFISKYNQTGVKTKQIIEKDDEIILDTLHDIQLSSANSIRQSTQKQIFNEQIQRILTKNQSRSSKILIIDVFKLNNKINNAKNHQNINGVQKMFGINNLKNSTNPNSTKQQINNQNKGNKKNPQFNFSFFDSILSEQNQIAYDIKNIQKPASLNINYSTVSAEHKNKKIQFSLIDL